MNGVKHYVKYSMNECINNLKKTVYLRSNDIYIWKGTSDTSERSQRAKPSNVPPERLPNLFWQNVPRQTFFV